VPRVSLLQKRGLQLVELPAGNVELSAYNSLLVKDWRWPERNLAGNGLVAAFLPRDDDRELSSSAIRQRVRS
jgi:hypothetical protein